MTIQDYKNQLLNYQNRFTSFLRYNLESPKRVQSIINETIEFLKSIKYDDALNEKVMQCIEELKLAYAHSEDFSKALTSDFSSKNDLATIHPDNDEWSQQVIGTAEAAMELILRHIG